MIVTAGLLIIVVYLAMAVGYYAGRYDERHRKKGREVSR